MYEPVFTACRKTHLDRRLDHVCGSSGIFLSAILDRPAYQGRCADVPIVQYTDRLTIIIALRMLDLYFGVCAHHLYFVIPLGHVGREICESKLAV